MREKMVIDSPELKEGENERFRKLEKTGKGQR